MNKPTKFALITAALCLGIAQAQAGTPPAGYPTEFSYTVKVDSVQSMGSGEFRMLARDLKSNVVIDKDFQLLQGVKVHTSASSSGTASRLTKGQIIGVIDDDATGKPADIWVLPHNYKP